MNALNSIVVLMSESATRGFYPGLTIGSLLRGRTMMPRERKVELFFKCILVPETPEGDEIMGACVILGYDDTGLYRYKLGELIPWGYAFVRTHDVILMRTPGILQLHAELRDHESRP